MTARRPAGGPGGGQLEAWLLAGLLLVAAARALGPAVTVSLAGAAVAARWWWSARRPARPSHPSRLAGGGRRSRGRRREQPAARWAGRADLRPLLVLRPVPGRLVIGRWGSRLLAAEGRHSLLVVGPTQTMKTSGLAVPAILEWRGPVVATSVKTDLVRDTLAARTAAGPTWVYDPAACTGLPAATWSPLRQATTWTGARRVAAALVAAAGDDGLTDGRFWYATAAKLLAPMLLAAAVSGRTMADVVAWVDTQEVAEVADVLERIGADEARRAAEASWMREDRQRSSVFTTAETVLEAFAGVHDGGAGCDIDPASLVDGGGGTLYLCAPAHHQKLLRPLFSALVQSVVDAAYERCALSGRPADPALLMVLDEAASIAPVEDLDVLAATGAGQGIQLVTVWQDLSQVAARYGARAASVVNNHRAKLILSGVSDAATLDQMSALVGEAETATSSTSTDESGRSTLTESSYLRRLAPPDALRRIRPGEGVLVYGHIPPATVRLRPWFAAAKPWWRAGTLRR